jgi:uncharacterized RDD family membrane protein YckC
MENFSGKHLPHTSLQKRLGAYGIDMVAIVSVHILIYFNFSQKLIEADVSGTYSQFAFFPLLLLIILKDLVRGKSLGKWLMDLAVRDSKDTTKTPSLFRLLLRNVPLPIWFVELFFLIRSTKGQRIGDTLAGTIVVDNPQKISKSARIYASIIVLVFFLYAILSIFIDVLTKLKETTAYKTAIQVIEKQADIQEKAGGISAYGMIPTGRVYTLKKRGIEMGQAYFQIYVIGKQESFYVDISLEKESNTTWKAVKIQK